MKSLFVFATVVSAFTFSAPAFSQCAGGPTAMTIIYDTTVIGNGNNSYAFSIPKFDPSLGTFLSVNFQSVVNLSYSYTLQNHDAVPVTFKTRTLRDDGVYAPEFDGADVSESHQTSQIINIVAANQSLVYGPAHFGYTLKDSINNGSLINFEGVGNVNYDYEQGTGYVLSTTGGTGNVNINFNYVHDTTQFTVIYKYCPNALLSTDMLLFTAAQQSMTSALLSWRQATVQQGRLYEVQMSTDGITFSRLALQEENANGAYEYTYLNNSAKKVFFRIQEKNASGEIKYSNIRLVEFNDDTKGTTVFPTLYSGGDLRFNFPEQGNWKINVYSAVGSLIAATQQKNVYSAQLTIPSSVSNGMYAVEIINTRTLRREVTRIVVQR
jgi:hypothetical protein